MRYSKDWEDYELIDCSSGYKLERWTREILVRPDPQVIWKSKRKINTGFSLMLPTFVQEQVVADGRYILKFLHLGR